MDDTLLELESNKKISDKQIFTEIWVAPRKVLKYVNHYKYDKFLYALLFIVGVVRSLDRAVDKGMGDTNSLFGILGLSIVFGGLLGWLSYYIYALLIRWTGEWIGGKADTKDILRILAYASIPSVVLLVLVLIQIMIYGVELFKTDGDLTSASVIGNIIFYSALFFEFVLLIYTLVFTIVGISEVQKFSKRKAFLNLLMPILGIIVPIIAIIAISGVLS